MFTEWTDMAGRRLETWIVQAYPLLMALVMALGFFNFFYHLGVGHVWGYDESRYGISAFEMAQTHDYRDTTFNYQLDMGCFKPPLGLWGILLGYKLFGFNTLGLRFISAVACSLTLFILMLFVEKRENKIISILAGAILSTTAPFLFNHAARRGDYSGILTFFFLLFLICLFKSEEKKFYFTLAGFFVSLAFLLYSFQVVFMLAVLVVFMAMTGLYRRLFAIHYAGFCLSAGLPVLAWALWRLSGPQGGAFLKGMFFVDVLQRSTTQMEGHVGNADYYLGYLGQEDLFWTLFLGSLLLSFFTAIEVNWNVKDRWMILTLLGFLLPLVFFSMVQSKLSWYLCPIYPSFAFLAAWLVYRILKSSQCRPPIKWVLCFLFVVAFCRSEREIWKQIRDEANPGTAQSLLLDLKNTGVAERTPVWIKNDWDPGDRFVAEVVCGFSPLSCDDVNGCLKSPGYLMLMEDLKDKNEDFVKVHHLQVVDRNKDWIMVKLR